MNQEVALTVALRGLGWLAGNEDLMPVFLGATGASLDDLRQRAEDPEFLSSVLDFLMMDDAWIVGFCDAEGLSYETPQRARQALPGGTETNWT